jgi:Acetyltransferase (GNAT) family
MRPELADFRGDFDKLATMIEASWSNTKAPSLLYSTPFLKSCFEYPGAGYSLAPTLYLDNEPVAFVAGQPRTLRYRNRDWKVLVVTFLTVATRCKNRGYGILVWEELVKRARAQGFHGMVNYCVDGEAMDTMIRGCCARSNVPCERIYSASYLFRILWPKKAEPLESYATLARPFLDAASVVSKSSPMARQWSLEEAKWQCARNGAVVARHELETRNGMLTGYIMELADQNQTLSLLIEDVLWGTLIEKDRGVLVRQFIDKASAQGARLAVVPDLGYADMAPFTSARFRPSPRLVHTYLTLWGEDLKVQPVPSLYLDII